MFWTRCATRWLLPNSGHGDACLAPTCCCCRLIDEDSSHPFFRRGLSSLFSKGEAIPTLKALSNVLHPSNQNLTPTQKIWQRWHFKLGHIAYSHIQKLPLGGFLDRVSMGLLRTRIADHPKCSACQFGKQTRLPDETTSTIKREDHLSSLKEGQLKPGDCIFCDQLESRVRGRLLHAAGRKPDKDRFCGATVFVDAASGYIHVEFQVTLNATDSINALDSLERSILHMGVVVNSYHTNNGIFKSKRFVHEIMKNSQSIRYSCVGSKWQNGVSEGAISIIASRARTLMIHAALHWPEVEDASLWPLAVSHAVQLYNHTPSGLPDGQAAKVLHPMVDILSTKQAC